MTLIVMPPRTRLGPFTVGGAAIHGGRFTAPTPMQCWSQGPIPDVTCSLYWQAGQFGLSASTAQTAQVSLTHRVDNTAAFDHINAQILSNGSAVGSPVALTPSITFITETVSTGGVTIPAANMGSIQLAVTWHQIGLGMAFASWSQALTPAFVASSGSASTLLMAGII